ncbi:MAG: PIG-L family deacetylase [Planctomycetota bacterium]|jgi:LmbE family N-acetylglucosaminyl deacetylase
MHEALHTLSIAAGRVGLLLACTLTGGRAQQGDSGYIALRQAVRDANSDRMVAIVASHPSDPYVMSASFLRFHYGFRVAVVLFTRGEGGQNSEGPEVGDALGQRRTLETEACASRLGFDVWYLNRPDAGYCRSAREALELWGRDATTRDLARTLRAIKPDIVLTPHGPEETHGHDLALIEILPDAVELAGNTSFETEGMEAITVPRFFMGAKSGAAELELDMDQWDEVRGDTYRQYAYRAVVEEHSSQAPFRPMDELFDPMVCLVGIEQGNVKPANNLTQGLPTLWASLGQSQELIQYNLEGMDELIERRQSLLRSALWLRHELLRLEGRNQQADLRLARRIEALEQIIWHSSNLRADISVPSGGAAVPGEVFEFSAVIHNAGRPAIRSLKLNSPEIINVEESQNPSHPTVRLDVEYAVPAMTARQDELLASPFRSERFEGPIDVALELEFAAGTASLVPPPGSASDSFGTLDLSYPAQSISFAVPIPARLRPAIELEVSPKRVMVPMDRNTVRIAATVRVNRPGLLDSTLQISTPPGFVANPPQHTIQLGLQDEREGSNIFDKRVTDGLRAGVHDLLLRVDEARGLRLGLIQGVDDSSAMVLKGLGVDLLRLDDEEVMTGDLQGLDTILIDIRALRHRPGVRGSFGRLLEYADKGGRLVILYHKDTEFGASRADALNLKIGRGRVTNEDAPVEALLPRHPLLNSPNQILPSDWDGWVQERGLYFAESYADRFQEILAMSDPGQPREKGSLIYSEFGRGEVIYCALALFRQLKNLHPGACRLFANLISRPR